MKKYLSLVLAFALILTTVVLPISASAEVGSEAIIITLSTDKTAYYGGDEITLTVNAKLNSQETASKTFSAVNFLVGYGSKVTKVDNQLALGTGLSSETSTVKYATGSTNGIGFTSTNLTLTNEDTTLYTAKFTANEVTETEAKKTFALYKGAANPVKFVNDDNTYGDDDVYCDTASLTFPAATEKVTVNANSTETDLKTDVMKTFHSTAAITVKVSMTEGNLKAAKLQKISTKGDTAATDVADADFSEVDLATAADNSWSSTAGDSGIYRVTVTTKSAKTAVYYFELKNEEVSAKISLETPTDLDNGYKPAATITVPVKISRLQSAVAAMVEFDVKYDTDVLSLDTTTEQTGVTFETTSAEGYNNKVLYGKNGTGSLADNANVVNLVFTVTSDVAKYGDTKVTISPIKWVEKNGINPVDNNLQSDATEVTAVVIPNDNAWGTVSGWKDAWTKDAYDITLSEVPTGVTVKLFNDEDGAVTDFANTTGVEFADNKANISDDTKHYTVLAAVGTSKQFTKQLDYKAPGQNGTWLDKTAPVLALEDMTSWESTLSASKDYTPDSTKVTETGSGNVKFVFSTASAENEVFTTATYETAAENYKVNATTSLTKLYVMGIDAVGNKSAVDEVSVKYDGDAPSATVATGNMSSDGQKRAIAISAISDSTSGVAKVELFKKVADLDDTSVKSWTEGFTSGLSEEVEAGTYYVVVTDNANNTYTSSDVTVSTTKVTAEKIKVATVKTKETATINDKGTEAAPFNLGTFTYIKLETANEKSADTYETTTELKKGDATVEATEGVYALDGTTAESTAIGSYTLKVTTTNKNDNVDTDSAYYTFTIVGTQADMKSVEDDAAFDAGDYFKMNKFTTNASTDNSVFAAGIYSADVNGDLSITAEDTAAVLKALQDVKYVGIYDFAIMNGITSDSNLFDGALD